MTTRRWMVLGLALSACGGATAKPTPPPEPEPVEAPKVETKLAILPVAKSKFPKAAAALDGALAEASMPDTTVRVAPVSIDVVQLSIECLEPTPDCHGGVARSLEVDQILFARLAAGGLKGEVRVEVLRTDATGATLGAASETFRNEAEAAAGAGALVTRALAARGEP